MCIDSLTILIPVLVFCLLDNHRFKHSDCIFYTVSLQVWMNDWFYFWGKIFLSFKKSVKCCDDCNFSEQEAPTQCLCRSALPILFQSREIWRIWLFYIDLSVTLESIPEDLSAAGEHNGDYLKTARQGGRKGNIWNHSWYGACIITP